MLELREADQDRYDQIVKRPASNPSRVIASSQPSRKSEVLASVESTKATHPSLPPAIDLPDQLLSDRCGEFGCEKLRNAPDLETAVGMRLLQPGHLKLLAIFYLVTRAYKAHAATYDDVARILQNPSCTALKGEVAEAIRDFMPDLPRSIATISKTVSRLESDLRIPLIHHLGEGLACDRLTSEGNRLSELFEAHVLKLLRNGPKIALA